jgi:cytochrome c oxidase assembly protein subunit 15
VLVLVLVTLVAGAFVAGLRAGLIYNSFPLMADSVVPSEYWDLAPWYRNWFENAAAAQFDHRLLAEATWAAALLVWLRARSLDLPRRARAALRALAALATVQVGLGIAALLLVVPLPLAVAHQIGAMLLLTAAVVARHQLRRAR